MSEVNLQQIYWLNLLIQGGAGSIQQILDNQAAELDFAEIRTLASPVTLTNAVQYVYQNTPGIPFKFEGGHFTQATGAWAGGESVTITVDIRIDGVNWANAWTLILIAAPVPAALGIPAQAVALTNIPSGFWNNGGGVRVGIVQTVVGAGYGTWNHSFIDGRRGT